MTMHFTIEKPIVKAAFVLLGVPISALVLLGLIDSIGLLLGGMQRHDPWPIAFGVGTLLSGIGILGAWLRILRPHAQLPVQRIFRIRRWLKAGVAGGALLAIGTVGMFSIDLGVFALGFVALSLGGLWLLTQTPSKQGSDTCNQRVA